MEKSRNNDGNIQLILFSELCDAPNTFVRTTSPYPLYRLQADATHT